VSASRAGRHQVRRPPRQLLSPEERALIRRADAQEAPLTTRQGLLERIEGSAAIAVLAALLRTARNQESTEDLGRIVSGHVYTFGPCWSISTFVTSTADRDQPDRRIVATRRSNAVGL
jgi:hypothetical protein